MTALTDEEKEQMLNELDDIHKPEEVEDLFGKFQDSVYQVKLNKIYFYKTKEQFKLVIEFEFISGTYNGRTVFKWCQMETEQNLDFLTNDLRKLGIKEFTWSTVEKQFPNVLDHTYEIELKTKGDFQNIYIKKEIKVTANNSRKKSSIYDTQEQKPVLEKDDIPF